MTNASPASIPARREGLASPGPEPYQIIHPARQKAPFVFASPHSGRHYPDDFIGASALDVTTLRASEDFYVDELFASAPQRGAPLLQALYARAFLDVNREPWELDPAMFDGPLPEYVNSRSGRVSAGLGTIARVVSSGTNIYRGKLSFSEAKQRVESIYMPYHNEQNELMSKTREQFGCAVLIDCHSMPSAGDTYGDMPLRRPRAKMPDFILGNRYGRSCAPAVIDVAEALLNDRGYSVVRNDPYSGGYSTRRHGDPKQGIHAMQIEISRAIYMDEVDLSRSEGFSTLASDMSDLVDQLMSISPDILLPQ